MPHTSQHIRYSACFCLIFWSWHGAVGGHKYHHIPQKYDMSTLLHLFIDNWRHRSCRPDLSNRRPTVNRETRNALTQQTVKRYFSSIFIPNICGRSYAALHYNYTRVFVKSLRRQRPEDLAFIQRHTRKYYNTLLDQCRHKPGHRKYLPLIFVRKNVALLLSVFYDVAAQQVSEKD